MNDGPFIPTMPSSAQPSREHREDMFGKWESLSNSFKVVVISCWHTGSYKHAISTSDEVLQIEFVLMLVCLSC